jgi:hypothetical protein
MEEIRMVLPDNTDQQIPSTTQNAVRETQDLTDARRLNALNCPKCGASNRLTSAFCVHCGEALAPTGQSKAQKFCTGCGGEVAKGTRFCGTCGAAIPSEDGNAVSESVIAAPKQSLPIKKIGIIASVAVLAMIAVTVCARLFAPSNYVTAKNSPAILRMADNGKQVIVSHANGNKETFDGDFYTQFFGSLDTTKGAFAVITGGDDSDPYVTTLYKIVNNKSTAFASIPNAANAYGILSADGSAVVWLVRLHFNEPPSLYIYRDDKTRLISDMDDILSFCVSPDGKTVAFIRSGNENICLIWRDGKIVDTFGDNVRPVALSNDGKLIYYYDYDSDGLYVKKGNDKVKLASGTSSMDFNMYFNKDNSSILYSGSTGVYVSHDGEEKIALAGRGPVRLLLPSAVVRIPVWYLDHSVIVNVNSFKGTFYTGLSGIYRITDQDQSERIAQSSKELPLTTSAAASAGTANAQLLADGKTILYLRSGGIYKVDGSRVKIKEEKLCDDEVVSFKALPDGSAFYFVNEANELYYQKGKGKPSLISDELDRNDKLWGWYGGDFFAVFGKDGSVFYLVDGKLYSSKAGSKGSLVRGVDSDNLYNIWAHNYAIYVYSSSLTEFYESIDGINFEKINSSDVLNQIIAFGAGS